MSYITTKDNIQIFYKDWGPRDAPVLFFHHGWPLSSDDWDNQLLFFVGQGFRVIAHDRRGHGRSTQVSDGHDMEHYADDVDAVISGLKIDKAIHIGHSTGGGEVVYYLNKYGQERASKAVLIAAVPPLLIQTDKNPNGVPKAVFDDFQKNLATNRSEFYYSIASGPFYGYNKEGAKASEAIILNWWRQGMMGGAKAHYDGIVAFSQTDFTSLLKSLTIPVLVMHSKDDQIVPYEISGLKSADLLPNSSLIMYTEFPHGMPTTEAETINKDLLAFIQQ
ncbi:alpha/beta fold hydrolase [Acinetobacter nectaris]|uniref:alpha/beta fold hydrolase n=1 Tax=Acinetobacter nectaris TaxID=1219382 RepID=UPI001F1D6EAB|nr:alpha/beta hydrolase [Acinetobacter nectaris]MCF8999318.1 alpha/beta hydrolase [Acinetobacter nectaris]MCF9028075.1 alpha/beta hydrolase [Acinetobacter nectaris]